VERITPEPTYRCRIYVSNALAVLRGECAYDPCVDCVDCFVSALAHATNPAQRKSCRVDELLQVARSAAEDAGATGVAHELAQALVAREEDIREPWAGGEQEPAA